MGLQRLNLYQATEIGKIKSKELTMNIKKYGSKLPKQMLDFLNDEKKKTGISVWRLIYNALIKYYPDYKGGKQ